MSSIDWQSFTWEAFATLATGAAAVVAATLVGFRQIRLAHQQTELARRERERGYHLNLATYQVSLLEARREFLRAFEEIWYEFLRDATLGHEKWGRLVRILLDAKLLFPEALAGRLDAAASSIQMHKLHRQRAQNYFEQGVEDKAQKQLTKAFEQDDKTLEALNGLFDELVRASRVSLPTSDANT